MKKGRDFVQPIDYDTLYSYFITAYKPTIQHRSESWKVQIAWAMFDYVLPVFGDKPIQSIKRADLQRFFNALPEKLSPRSKKTIRIVLSGVLKLAVQDEIISTNHAASVRLPEPDEPNVTILSPGQLMQLYQAAPNWVKPVILLQGFAGLRIGEACGVTWHQIEPGVLHVTQQVLQNKGGASISQRLKHPNSKAPIPLSKPLEAALRSNQMHPIFVCWNKTGYALPNAVQVEYDKLSAALDLPRFTTHDLRRTFLTIMESEVEAPASVVAKLGRKSKTKLGTIGTYLHPDLTKSRKWMDRYWNLCLQELTEFLTEKEG